MSLPKRNGYTSDAEACGRQTFEILYCRKPKVWAHLGDGELAYIKWLATWAFHWANLAKNIAV